MDWRDSTRLPRLRNQPLFDRAQAIYPDDWKRFQADLLRLELLWQFGGVYVDTDTEPLQPLDDLVGGLSCFVAHSPQHIRGVHPLTQAVIGAEAGHPFIGALIDGAAEAVERFGHRTLAQSVGPWHITRTYEADDWPTVTTLPHSFYGEWVDHKWNNARRKAGRGLG